MGQFEDLCYLLVSLIWRLLERRTCAGSDLKENGCDISPLEMPMIKDPVYTNDSTLVLPNHPEVFNFSPETVVIIGNGAVCNEVAGSDSWAPARRALDAHPGEVGGGEKAELYSELAPDVRLAHKGFFSRITLLSMLRENERTLEAAEYGQYIKQLEPSLKQLEDFRRTLAQEYSQAVNGQEIALRELPHEIEVALSPEKTGVITTNWDELIWQDARFSHVLQLHGRAGIGGSLILPTENMIDDDIMRNLYRSSALSEQDEILMGAYNQVGRGEKAASELFLAYNYARNWVRDAKKLIIYGIAGHIYDVELHSIFLGMGDAPKESVIVIDKCSRVIKNWGNMLQVREPVLRPVVVRSE
jgi:hypothetical protein